MTKPSVLLGMFLLLPLTASADAHSSLSLNSLSDAWSLRLLFTAKASCSIESKPGPREKSQTKTIDATECKVLKKDFEDLKIEIANHQVALKKPAPPANNDQPDFQLETGGVKFYEHLIAPAVCDMDKDGKMNCTQNDLSGSQRLLLRMLDYAQSMKLGPLPRRK